MILKKKTIAVIKTHNQHSPDAGHWIFDDLNNKWIENSSLVDESKSFYTLRREVSNSNYKFHVDSFPRQGNTTLRSILLQVFPDLLMPDPMVHVTTVTLDAIKNNDVVISTVRDPHEALASFISRAVYSDEIYKNIFILKNKIPKLVINNSIKFYNRYTNFIIDNNKNIQIIEFETILQMYRDFLNFRESENIILKKISQKYNLKFTTDKRPRYNSVKYTSTVDKKIRSYLINDKFYLKKIKKSYKLYLQILKLIEENEKLLST